MVSSLQTIQTGGNFGAAFPQAISTASNQLFPVLSEAIEALTPAAPLLSETLSVVNQQLPQLASSFVPLGRRQPIFTYNSVYNGINGDVPIFEEISPAVAEGLPLYRGNTPPASIATSPYIDDGIQYAFQKHSRNPYLVYPSSLYSQYQQKPFRYVVV